MTNQLRAELLLSYAKGPQLLKQALALYPAEAMDFKPGPGKWSLRDIAFHLAESEVQGYVRARTAMAEPGNPVLAYDQDKWAATLDTDSQPLEEAVELFRLLRELMARQLRALPAQAWERTVLHPQRGPMTLEKWLEVYEGHLRVHLAQMERTHQAWRAS